MADDRREGLLRAAVETLRPLVRRLLASGVPFGMLESSLRDLVVEVAEAEFTLEGRRQTDSRVSLVTGINRKEVRRIRGRTPRPERPPSFGRNRAESLFGRWCADPRAADRAGNPKPLPYKARSGPSFSSLAGQVTVDLPARALLDELVRIGAVTVRADGWIVPRGGAYVPTRARSEKLAMVAEDPADLVETMLRNVFEETGEPLLQRRVRYDNIGAHSLPKLRRRLRGAAEGFLRQVDRLLAAHDHDRNPKAPGGERHVAGLGVYYFESPHARKPGPATKSARRRQGEEESEK